MVLPTNKWGNSKKIKKELPLHPLLEQVTVPASFSLFISALAKPTSSATSAIAGKEAAEGGDGCGVIMTHKDLKKLRETSNVT